MTLSQRAWRNRPSKHQSLAESPKFHEAWTKITPTCSSFHSLSSHYNSNKFSGKLPPWNSTCRLCPSVDRAQWTCSVRWLRNWFQPYTNTPKWKSSYSLASSAPSSRPHKSKTDIVKFYKTSEKENGLIIKRSDDWTSVGSGWFKAKCIPTSPHYRKEWR